MSGAVGPDVVLAVLTYFAIAFVGGAVGGMLALGGVLVTTPLLALIPVDGRTMSLADIGLLNLVMVTAATAVSTLVHGRVGRIDWTLVWRMGPPLGLGGLVGALLVDHLADRVLNLGFGLLALLAVAVSILGRVLERRARMRQEPAERMAADLSRAETGWLMAATGGTGVLSGLVGAGGGFIITPILLHIVRMPPKAVVGSMSVVGVFVIGGNVVGRGSDLLSIDPIAAAGVAVGGALGGLAGAEVVRVISPGAIRALVLALIAFNALRVVAGELH